MLLVHTTVALLAAFGRPSAEDAGSPQRTAVRAHAELNGGRRRSDGAPRLWPGLKNWTTKAQHKAERQNVLKQRQTIRSQGPTAHGKHTGARQKRPLADGWRRPPPQPYRVKPCDQYQRCLGGTLPLKPHETAARSVRVLCLVLCRQKRRGSCEAVQRSWGRDCDKLVFAADFDDAALGAVNVHASWEGQRDVTRNKLARGIRHVLAHENVSGYDWFVKADDDTFLLVDNLRRCVLCALPRAARPVRPS
jgi:hypothetical protein